MRIVFIGPFGLQPKGTVSVRALPLAKALADRGHEVTVLIPPWDDPDRSDQTWTDNGVQVVNVRLPGRGLPRLPVFFHLLLTRTLVARALAAQPEVIHLFKPKAYAGLSHLLLWWLRRLSGRSVRLVVDADDWEQAWNEVLPYAPALKKFFTWQERWGLSRADAVTVASHTLAELLDTRLGVDPDRVFYVPNGDHSDLTADRRLPTAKVNGSPARSAVQRQAPTILLYSRFAEFRLERIINLVRYVARQMPQARWLVVGRGFRSEEKLLETQLAQAGLAEYVHFAGWVSSERLPTYFREADLAVYPYDDTLLNRTKCSVKLIDLLAAGLPVVADAVGQNCEYIQHEQSGILISAQDDEAFAQAIVTLLQEPATRHRLGQAAREHIQQNFAWPKLAQIVERSYIIDAV